MNLAVSEVAQDLLQKERYTLADLQTLLARLDAPESDVQDLRHALRDLEGLFMLVVCGEYNAGKSTFLNALLGEQVLLEGVTPTTDRITIVTYGQNDKTQADGDFILRRTYPAEILRELALVDTPGTNAVITQHQELTQEFIPRADLVLFLTSADRPFSESERSFLDLIRSWGKKIIILVNKLDILESNTEKEQVLAFVKDQARQTLGVTPQVFGLSSRLAKREKQAEEMPINESGLHNVETYIQNTITGNERIKLKLQNPLGVALRLTNTNANLLTERLGLLADDKRTLEEVDRQREVFRHDMERDVSSHLSRIKTTLLEVERRGDIFFDDTVQFRKILTLMNSDKIKAAFEKQVIRGADREIEQAVSDMVDWFIQRHLQLWEDVMSFVQERRQASEARMVGEVGTRFQYDRDTLIQNLQGRAEDTLQTYDEQKESSRLAERLQASVMRSGLLQLGGVALGAGLVAVLSGALFDITGITLGLTVAGVGLLVLPTQRRQAKRELHTKMQSLRDGLEQGLTQQVALELDRATEKLSSAIAPYTRFVRAELDKLESLQQELSGKKRELLTLQGMIEAL